MQSDASGEDGYGYYHGHLSQTNLEYYHAPWEQPKPTSTFCMELTALVTFVMQCNAANLRDKILVWLTDSTSAALAVNKGNCRDPAGRKLLSNILESCDGLHLEIVALWVPRERNIIADYLSHMSYFNSGSGQGRLNELIAKQELREQDC